MSLKTQENYRPDSGAVPAFAKQSPRLRSTQIPSLLALAGRPEVMSRRGRRAPGTRTTGTGAAAAAPLTTEANMLPPVSRKLDLSVHRDPGELTRPAERRRP